MNSPCSCILNQLSVNCIPPTHETSTRIHLRFKLNPKIPVASQRILRWHISRTTSPLTSLCQHMHTYNTKNVARMCVAHVGCVCVYLHRLSGVVGAL